MARVGVFDVLKGGARFQAGTYALLLNKFVRVTPVTDTTTFVEYQMGATGHQGIIIDEEYATINLLLATVDPDAAFDFYVYSVDGIVVDEERTLRCEDIICVYESPDITLPDGSHSVIMLYKEACMVHNKTNTLRLKRLIIKAEFYTRGQNVGVVNRLNSNDEGTPAGRPTMAPTTAAPTTSAPTTNPD